MSLQANQTTPFDDSDLFRSLALEVEGRTFWVPRDTLASYSPVLKSMACKELLEPSLEAIKISGKAAEILELLRCIIPTPFTKDIDDSNVELILAF